MQSNHLIRQLRATAFVCLCLLLSSALAFAQQAGTTRYVYDDNGRLRAVIAPNGEAGIYEYDAAGNIKNIRRNAANQLEILDFFPRQGVPGTTVKIIGTGFGTGVTRVTFNGMTATSFTTNAPQITVTLPAGATTGPIAITTASGTATSAQPFTVRGITVTPLTSDVLSLAVVQFMATALVMDDQQVVWGVEGVTGGNATVGAITPTGLYTAPKLPDTQPFRVLRIQAASATEVSVVGEAVVTVRNPIFYPPVYASPVSVVKSAPSNLYSQPITVANGNPSTPFVTVFARPVTVVKGSLSNLYAQPLVVVNGNLSVKAVTVFAQPISVLKNVPSNLFSLAATVTKGPGVTAVSPAQVAKGMTKTLTITGLNLTGAKEIIFLNPINDTLVTDLTVTNLNVNSAGTSLTVNVSAGSAVSLGRRVLVVKTPNGLSGLLPTATNTLEVTP